MADENDTEETSKDEQEQYSGEGDDISPAEQTRARETDENPDDVDADVDDGDADADDGDADVDDGDADADE